MAVAAVTGVRPTWTTSLPAPLLEARIWPSHPVVNRVLPIQVAEVTAPWCATAGAGTRDSVSIASRETVPLWVPTAAQCALGATAVTMSPVCRARTVPSTVIVPSRRPDQIRPVASVAMAVVLGSVRSPTSRAVSMPRLRHRGVDWVIMMLAAGTVDESAGVR